QCPDFLKGAFNEFLSAKSRVHRHYTNQVNIRNDIFQQVYISMRIDGYSSLTAKCLYFLYGSVQVFAGFIMFGNGGSSCLLEGIQVALGVYNQQVNIQWFTGMFFYG